MSEALESHFVGFFPRVNWSERGVTTGTYKIGYGEFTPSKFIEDLHDNRGMGDLQRVTFAPRHQSYFFLERRRNNTVALMKLHVGQREPVYLGRLPSTSGGYALSGLTYDDKRDRILVLLHEIRSAPTEPELLYAYSPSTDSWQKLYEENARPFEHQFLATAIAYSHADDRLYILREFTDERYLDVWLPTNGTQVRHHRLGRITNVDIAQMIAVGDFLILVDDFPRSYSGEGKAFRRNAQYGYLKLHTHVVESKSGKVLAARAIELPEFDWCDGERLHSAYH